MTAAMLWAAPAVACKDDYDRVIQDEDQQERLDWKFTQAFNNRCLFKKADYDHAMRDCNQALRYDPKAERCREIPRLRAEMMEQRVSNGEAQTAEQLDT